MRTIQLTGHLSTFGDEFTLDFSSVSEAIRALCYQIRGFEEALKEGAYRVVRLYGNRSDELGEEELGIGLGSAIGVRIEPVIMGAKKSGLGKIILGVVLIGAAFFFSGGALGATAFSVAGMGVTYGQIALVGGLMLLSGVAGMLAPEVKQATDDKRDEVKSFLFEGPRNVVEQGHPVPIVYGRVHTGSVIISTGIATEELPV